MKRIMKSSFDAFYLIIVLGFESYSVNIIISKHSIKEFALRKKKKKFPFFFFFPCSYSNFSGMEDLVIVRNNKI
jgi:hypothetical protein